LLLLIDHVLLYPDAAEKLGGGEGL